MSTYPYTARPLIDRPCPPWCELRPGHGWESAETDTGRESRGHGRELGPHVDLCLTEYADAPLGAEPVTLLVSVDPDDMTAAEVRQLAAELLNAADELDKVSGATRTGDAL